MVGAASALCIVTYELSQLCSRARAEQFERVSWSADALPWSLRHCLCQQHFLFPAVAAATLSLQPLLQHGMFWDAVHPQQPLLHSPQRFGLVSCLLIRQ
jgi:hypothetical protein